MKCWICNVNEADSGEHIFKASDVRSHFDKNKTLYKHEVGGKINNKVPGVKSDKLKFLNKICAHCNNVRTQPYDEAWECLSKYFQSNWSIIKNNKRFDLSKVFPGKTKQGLLFVHLYFVKQFGCKIVEENLPIDLSKFSCAIMGGTSHPEVRMIFCETPVISFTKKFIHSSDVVPSYDSKTGVLTSARWVYTVNPFSVRIEFVDGKYVDRFRPYQFIHPSAAQKSIKLGAYLVKH